MENEILKETLHVDIDSSLEDGWTVPPDVAERLTRCNGIDEVRSDQNGIIIEYQPYVISAESVYQHLAEEGIPVLGQSRKKRGFLHRFINRLASENRDSLGDRPFDCCDLNRNNRVR